MDSQFLTRLVHPIYKSPLSYNAVSQQLADDGHGDHFTIREGVPLMISTAEAELQVSEMHASAGSTFNYKEHYQHDAETYDYFQEAESAATKEESNRLHQYILSEIPKTADWILDTGCGGGWLANALQHKGKHLISMDISDINPIKVTKRYPFEGHYGLVADVYALPIKGETMDCIIASEIIEHVSDPKRFIYALYTALKPGGKLIITTPYNEKIQQSLCIHCNQLTPHNAHLHSFTETNIKRHLSPEMTMYKTKVFNNKVLTRTGLQRAMSFLPLGLYEGIDSLSNAVTKKRAYRLMLTIEK